MPPTYHQNKDMWNVLNQSDLFLIPANATVKKDGALVMGRGLAKQAQQRYPMLPYTFGKLLRNRITPYGILCATPPVDFPAQIGLFQTKDRWDRPAEIALIAYSCGMLRGLAESALEECEAVGAEPPIFRLAFPGIGNGKLAKADVLPFLQLLPPCVHVYSHDSY